VLFINRTSEKKEGVLCKLLEFFSSLGAQGMINGTSMHMCHIYKCKLDYVSITSFFWYRFFGD
jgi:hypothetical protein